MFEIIMLFAFLAAATSQLLPSESSRSKFISRLKKRPVRKDFEPGKSFQKQQGQPGNGRTHKDLNSACACAV
jgi:hypothetical protein